MHIIKRGIVFLPDSAVNSANWCCGAETTAAKNCCHGAFSSCFLDAKDEEQFLRDFDVADRISFEPFCQNRVFFIFAAPIQDAGGGWTIVKTFDSITKAFLSLGLAQGGQNHIFFTNEVFVEAGQEPIVPFKDYFWRKVSGEEENTVRATVGLKPDGTLCFDRAIAQYQKDVQESLDDGRIVEIEEDVIMDIDFEGKRGTYKKFPTWKVVNPNNPPAGFSKSGIDKVSGEQLYNYCLRLPVRRNGSFTANITAVRVPFLKQIADDDQIDFLTCPDTVDHLNHFSHCLNWKYHDFTSLSVNKGRNGCGGPGLCVHGKAGVCRDCVRPGSAAFSPYILYRKADVNSYPRFAGFQWEEVSD